MKIIKLKSLLENREKLMGESSFPPGFGSSDVESVEKFIKSSGISSAKTEELNEETDAEVVVKVETPDRKEYEIQGYDKAINIAKNYSYGYDKNKIVKLRFSLNGENWVEMWKGGIWRGRYHDHSNLNETGAGHDIAGDNVSDIDVDDMMAKKLAGEKDKEIPYVHASNIRDENGNPIDPEELKKKITAKPDHILSQNAKIKKSGKGKTYVFYNITLPAYKGLFYDENDRKFKIITTCPSAGACKVFCYARKGGYVMFPAASEKSTKIVNFLMNHWQDFKSQLVREIKEAHSKNKKDGTKVVIRWHDSGDFMSEKYLQIAYDIAKETPEVIHYAYTKRVKMVSGSQVPKNFVFNFSMGGTEDASIDKKTQKHSEVVPKKLFHDLGGKDKTLGKFKFNSKEAEDTFKERMASHYNIPKNSIITYNELMDIEYNEDDESMEQKYNVIVAPGDGDDSAMRKDVLGTYLLIH